MRKRTVVIIISLFCAFIVMSGGYGLWTKQIKIVGNIEVRPEPKQDQSPGVGKGKTIIVTNDQDSNESGKMNEGNSSMTQNPDQLNSTGPNRAVMTESNTSPTDTTVEESKMEDTTIDEVTGMESVESKTSSQTESDQVQEGSQMESITSDKSSNRDTSDDELESEPEDVSQ